MQRRYPCNWLTNDKSINESIADSIDSETKCEEPPSSSIIKVRCTHFQFIFFFFWKIEPNQLTTEISIGNRKATCSPSQYGNNFFLTFSRIGRMYLSRYLYAEDLQFSFSNSRCIWLKMLCITLALYFLFLWLAVIINGSVQFLTIRVLFCWVDSYKPWLLECFYLFETFNIQGFAWVYSLLIETSDAFFLALESSSGC